MYGKSYMITYKQGACECTLSIPDFKNISCWNVSVANVWPASAALDTTATRALCPSRRCRMRAKELASAAQA